MRSSIECRRDLVNFGGRENSLNENLMISRIKQFEKEDFLNRDEMRTVRSRSVSNLNCCGFNYKIEEKKIKRSKSVEKESISGDIQNGDVFSWTNQGKTKQDDGDIIWHLRSFNNWAKSYLMIKAIARRDNYFVGLDLGCSRGTDLKKWNHCHIDHLYLVESDHLAMSECQQRYFNLKSTWEKFYTATFIDKDFSRECIRIPEYVDIVSCQMALHKAFESKAKAEMMARNIANSLKYGGTFVASITSASKILKFLQNSPDRTSFGNSIFEVKMSKPIQKEKPLPYFGVKFHFQVGGNKFEEYLVQTPVLERIMGKYGLMLEESTSFLEMYFSARRNIDQVRCMQKMGVVRKGYERKNDFKVYLTMSDSEIQAASFYEALTFRKI